VQSGERLAAVDLSSRPPTCHFLLYTEYLLQQINRVLVVTEYPRFNIGTAAAAVTAAAVASLGLTSTGADSAVEWSPEAVGEPGEDFPPFTVIRHVILQPIGLDLLSIHCGTIARRSMSRALTTIPCVAGG
jgi:hypothetical protein